MNNQKLLEIMLEELKAMEEEGLIDEGLGDLLQGLRAKGSGAKAALGSIRDKIKSATSGARAAGLDRESQSRLDFLTKDVQKRIESAKNSAEKLQAWHKKKGLEVPKGLSSAVEELEGLGQRLPDLIRKGPKPPKPPEPEWEPLQKVKGTGKSKKIDDIPLTKGDFKPRQVDSDDPLGAMVGGDRGVRVGADDLERYSRDVETVRKSKPEAKPRKRSGPPRELGTSGPGAFPGVYGAKGNVRRKVGSGAAEKEPDSAPRRGSFRKKRKSARDVVDQGKANFKRSMNEEEEAAARGLADDIFEELGGSFARCDSQPGMPDRTGTRPSGFSKGVPGAGGSHVRLKEDG